MGNLEFYSIVILFSSIQVNKSPMM